MQKLFLTIIFLGIFLLSPFSIQAQEGFVDTEFVKARILDKNITGMYQDLHEYSALLSSGEVIIFEAVESHIKIGDAVYLEYYPEAKEYVFTTINRTTPLIILLVFFVALVILLTRKKGLRSLLSLVLSFILLIGFFIPLLFKAYDPIALSLIFGSLILFLSIFVTHGFSRQSSISFLGSLISIVVAYVLVLLITYFGNFSGITDHSTLFLNDFSPEALDYVRLFSSAVIIGTLGVLDDITVTQVAVVRELAQSSSESPQGIFIRALRVGKDHISSLVNTLVFAYLGSSLPLIMFMSQLNIPIFVLISQEFVAAEIVRALVGAIALVIAVPITTWCACYPFFSYLKKDSSEIIGHGHSHK